MSEEKVIKIVLPVVKKGSSWKWRSMFILFILIKFLLIIKIYYLYYTNLKTRKHNKILLVF